MCHAPLVLLLQLNGDLPDRFPGHERRLYVFSCRNKGCRRKEGGIRALRATRVSAAAAEAVGAERREKEAEKERRERERREREEKVGKLGEAVFGVAGKNPFAANNNAGAGGNAANPFSTGGGGAVNPFAKPTSTTSGSANANPFSSSSSATSTPAASSSQTDKAATTETTTTTAQDEAKEDLPRTFAETLSLNNTQKTKIPIPPPEPWPAESDLPAPYPVSYLSEAEYETLDPLPPPMPPQAISTTDLDEASGGGGGGGSGGKEDKDVFESTIDATFQKFADRLAQNPDQCIRYEFGGQPLLYSKTDAVGKKLHDVVSSGVGGGGGGTALSKVLPRCGRCGSGRVFEVQLTPQAIVELEEGDAGDEGAGLNLEGMDWGTVIVGVCERDCFGEGGGEGETAYVEEWVGVQWEELTARR